MRSTSGKRSRRIDGYMPPAVELGHYHFRFVADDRRLDSKDDGTVDWDSEEIIVRAGARGRALVYLVEHELTHVVWELGSLDRVLRAMDGPLEEAAVCVESALRSELWIRNPALLEWIHRTLRDEG